jgi:signal transduction histidine kinase
VIQAPILPLVRGDMSQLAHVFQNVLSNALKYRQKGVPPEIWVSAKQEGDRWIIAVRDNGIGFEQKYADRIFGLFKRLHKDEYPGTGLGLAICKRIVERYGGRMWAESQPGEGATFFFSLPRVS